MSFRIRRPFLYSLILLLALIGMAPSARAQSGLTSPQQEFGFEVGADYQLINYARFSAYWKKLDAQSDRMSLVEIGRSSEGRPILMAIVTSPANHRRLARYKDISKRLALAEGLTEVQARALALEGKAVVWIDGGLHATEVVGGQQLIELVWRMVSRNDAETRRILDEVILLAVPVNPDGMDLVADWYMRDPDPKKRSTGSIPRLYQKYVGHDNNRDYYMVTQPESEAVSRQLYIDWHPQFLYNQHQTGPQGTVLFCPPFRDPFNYYFDPLVAVGTDLLGLAMHERFLAEDKPGAIMRSGAGYSTWWNGGLRSTGYFHNIPGILTEIIGNPTPISIPFIPSRMLPKGDYPYPIMPQEWHMRSSVEYSVTADMAILDFAARRREEILFNRWLMGRNAIEKGSRDNWTFQPKAVAEIQAKAEAERNAAAGAGQGGGGMRGGAAASSKLYEALREPSKRDPRGFILPSDQPDFSTATKFVNTLIKSGVKAHRATRAFEVGGKSYPEGSYVVLAAQAFRPHVLSMFEPQDHPNDFPYPGGPPNPPYDSAGWTVAFQMGIVFDRILDGFSGPFEEIRGFARLPARPVEAKAAGFIVDHRINDAAVAANRILKAGGEVFWMKAAVKAGGISFPAGALYIPNDPKILPLLEKAGKDLGLPFHSSASRPAGEAIRLRPVRIGVWDNYGGSMSSGWTQWVLDQYEFPWKAVYAPELDSGNLRDKYDVLIFASGGIPGAAGSGRMGGFGAATPANIPDEYKAMIGRVSVDKTVPHLKKFLEDGGTILTIGSSTGLAYHLGLPVRNHLTEKGPAGRDVPLPSEKYYVPGSILSARIDAANPLAYGMNETTDFFFDGSPVFGLDPEAALSGIRPIAWFDRANPLRSGWAWGESYLKGGVAVAEAPVGRGRLVLLGPEVLFRGQPHGTFKLVFNGIHLSAAENK